MAVQANVGGLVISLTSAQVDDCAGQLLDTALGKAAEMYELDGRPDVAYALTKS